MPRNGNGADDPLVDVNHRGLIINGFARYPVKFAVFRELLQNSDDAQARCVEIRFETRDVYERGGNRENVDATEDRDLDLSAAEIYSCSFRNNGDPFTEDDWKRILKIGAGNPNEHKVGGFGVGFYSVFSVTNEPIIISHGRQLRLFFESSSDRLRTEWQQVTRQDLHHHEWTVFMMKLKQPGRLIDVFDLFDLTQFLVSALAFTKHVAEISLRLDNTRVAVITKTESDSIPTTLLPTLKPVSPKGVMTVNKVKAIPVRIAVKIAQCVYSTADTKRKPFRVLRTDGNPSSSHARMSTLLGSRTAPPFTLPPSSAQEGYSEHSVEFFIYAATVAVKLSTRMSSDLKHLIGKSLPKALRYQLIYISKDQYDKSIQEDDAYPSTIGRLFQALRASLEGQNTSLIFVGQATTQTTGIGGHMWSRFIPTSERQSIDLANGSVKVWNEELLYVGGYLARTIYESELVKLHQSWPSGPIDIRSSAYQQALHVIQFFTFHRSTPSPEVSDRLRQAFLSCSATKTCSVISSAGIRDLWSIRIFNDPSYAKFIKNWPTLPDKDDKRVKQMIQSVLDHDEFDKLHLRAQDCINEFKERTLDGSEGVDLLLWFNRLRLDPEAKEKQLAELKGMIFPHVRITTTAPNGHMTTFTLGAIRYFVDSSYVASNLPANAPLPENVIPSNLSRTFDAKCLQWFGWKPLTTVDWLRCVVASGVREADATYDITKSPRCAEEVLTFLAKAWISLTLEQRSEVTHILEGITCIPTSAGIVLPREAFIHATAVLRELPVLRLPQLGAGDFAMLQDLGVRQHVDFRTFLEKFVEMKEHGNEDLVQYLLNARNSLDRATLRETPVFACESNTEAGAEQRTLCNIRDLYQPLDMFRRLGLPVLKWSRPWNQSSPEAVLLGELGLQSVPTLETVIGCCSHRNESIHQSAFMLLLQNLDNVYPEYNPEKFRDVAFIPAVGPGGSHRLCKSKEVFLDQSWQMLDFPVIGLHWINDSNPRTRDEMLRRLQQLGVQESPSIPTILVALKSHPPMSNWAANNLFAFLSRHDFSTRDLDVISRIDIVPVTAESSRSSVGMSPEGLRVPRLLPPSQCFFKQPRKSYYTKLFGFVDFEGPAKTFLMGCRVRDQPTGEDIAEALVRDPVAFWNMAGKDQLLVELRKIAADYDGFPDELKVTMKTTAVLPASPWRFRGSARDSETSMPGEPADHDELKQPSDIIIIDDLSSCSLLPDGAWTHPQDDLEGFYVKLGAKLLSSLITPHFKQLMEINDKDFCDHYRHEILSRLPLFLHYFGHQPKIPYSKLKEETFFVVKRCKKITVWKSIDYEGHSPKETPREEETSACAENKDGTIVLWLTKDVKNPSDMMYDVATSFCRLLFEAPKANDFLLFMTMLSTKLSVLQQRGYNVDEIIGQMEKQAVESEEPQCTPDSVLIPPSRENTPSPIDVPSFSQTSVDKPSVFRKIHGMLTVPKSTFSRFRMREAPLGTIEHQFGHYVPEVMQLCRQELEQSLKNDPRVKESEHLSKEEYCNVRSTLSLDLLQHAQGIPVYVTARGEGGLQTQNQDLRFDTLRRFVDILLRLCRIFKLEPKMLHIFYHKERGLMGFNRNGSIFLSWFHYEWKHDTQVREGRMDKALISWYFVMAHEIAHNMFSNHDENHEFLFSEICQQYLENLQIELSAGSATV
ncbi:hypothetical protein OBBRIDRAFT_885709 [Obba rivulosa]|uniref:Sacsin/Nov domain-containing protein n=1 Tax=Obba rivulosa TaxID=1052685 RepID=A0A8E2DP60_9APHY|nr:hypothetical protein OBBRIDRAFT_885709 [Obba rivulosa]